MRVDDMWLSVKRRLVSQRLSRGLDLEGLDPLCEHDWTMVLEQATWSGSLRLSTCTQCAAELREWPAAPAAADGDPPPR